MGRRRRRRNGAGGPGPTFPARADPSLLTTSAKPVDINDIDPFAGTIAAVAPPALGPPETRNDAHLKAVEALTAALNKSAERIQTLWFTFLGVTLYFALTVGGTTHRMLFLEEGLKLPIVDLQLPLLGFYFIAPAFYVLFHAYFLMMLVLLARTAGAFNRTLETAFPADEDEKLREDFRMRAENAIFLQIICGAKRERSGAHARILRLIASLSLAVVPILLLLMFQLMFLPYHHPWLTWWHRALVAFDLLLTLTLWGSYLHRFGERLFPYHDIIANFLSKVRNFRWMNLRARVRNFRRSNLQLGDKRLNLVYGLIFIVRGLMSIFIGFTKIVASVAALFVAFAMATWPGERLHQNSYAKTLDDLARPWFRTVALRLGVPPIDAGYLGFDPPPAYEDFALSAFLFGYEPTEFVTSANRGLFPNRMWLPNETLVDEDKLRRLQAGGRYQGVSRNVYSINVAGRDFANAIFIAADLRGADFKNARVAGATFEGSWLHHSRFEVKDSAGVNLRLAEMSGASLLSAELHGASLRNAKLEGADLSHAQLQAADLNSANLQGAYLSDTDLKGAWLEAARLSGAVIVGANMSGAALEDADLRGAQFTGTNLVGATFADEYGGRPALATGASFDGNNLFRSTISRVRGENVKILGNYFVIRVDFADLLNQILARAPSYQRDTIRARLAHLSRPFETADELKVMQDEYEAWSKRTKAISEEMYRKVLALILSEVSCNARSGNYAIRGISMGSITKPGQTRLADLGPAEIKSFYERIEKSARAKAEEAIDCPGARGVTEDVLLSIADLIPK